MGYIIKHFHHIDAAIFGYRKFNVLRNRIAICRSDFNKCISFSGNQFCFDFVRCRRRCPLINHLSILIFYHQMTARKFFTSRNLLFGNHNMRRLVLHFDLIDRSVMAYFKRNIFRIGPTVCRTNLPQCIFLICDQLLLNFMRLIGRNPLIYHISILINDLQRTAWQLFTSRNLLFGNYNMGRLVFHFDLIDRSVMTYLKRHIFRIGPTVRRTNLSQHITLINYQFCNDFMRLVRRDPLLYYVSILIYDLKQRTRKFLTVCDFLFR